jgi:hypothetical protein
LPTVAKLCFPHAELIDHRQDSYVEVVGPAGPFEIWIGGSTVARAAFQRKRRIAGRDPGAAVGAVYGEMMNAIMRGDGDPSASRWPMGCGEEALLVRYHTGHGTVAPRDQVQFEIAGACRSRHCQPDHRAVWQPRAAADGRGARRSPGSRPRATEIKK